MVKLKNRFYENLHLELDDKELGKLIVAVISDMTKEGKIGPMTPMQHLKEEEYVQRHSYLKPHQWLPIDDAKEVLEDPRERYYTHVVAELKGKGVGFSVFDKAKFDDGESYVKVFYMPTILMTKNANFSEAIVVKANGRKEPLEQLILKLSLRQIDGKNLLAVFDAPEAELGKLSQYRFRALAPEFDVPDLRFKTGSESQAADIVYADKVYMVVRVPKESDFSRHREGIELDKALQLFKGYLMEGYCSDKHANGSGMYLDGIKKLVDSAIKVHDKVIVPYKNLSPNSCFVNP